MTARGYIGRFAPSPTGPLHFGSLLAAVASYLDARAQQGRWLLRVEDIDPPREAKHAATSILRTLEAYGFEWDGPTVFQSRSASAHADAISELDAKGLTYYCKCSRRTLGSAADGELGKIYPGTCRNKSVTGSAAVRIRVTGQTRFDDRIQGTQTMDLASESGDFVIRRRDGLVAYHLAVVVDDVLEGVTHIVRGIDLMPSTHRQIFIQMCLGSESPSYAHIPVAVSEDGDKLSKLTHAAPLPLERPETLLYRALIALRQDNLKKRLAYSTVGHLSYIVLGVALLSPSGFAGGMFHLAAHAFMKITLFFCAGAVYVSLHRENVSELDGVGKVMPLKRSLPRVWITAESITCTSSPIMVW